MKGRANLGIFLSAIACTAHAETPAEQNFREGRDAIAAKDYATACPKFAESQRLEPAPGTLLNLADCEEHIGQFVKAREHYSLAATGFARSDARREFTLKRAASLEARIAHITIRLAPGAPSGTIVRLANTILDSSALGAPIANDPGEASIVVVAPGRINRPYAVRLSEGASAEVVVDVGEPQPTTTVVKTVQEKSTLGTRRIAGLTLMGLGFVGVTIGAVAGVFAIDKASTVKSHCDAQVVCDPQGFAAANDGNVLSPVSTVALFAGGGLMAIGAVFLLVGGKSPSKTSFDISPFGASVRHAF